MSDVFFPNLIATSPDGRFALSAESPDNNPANSDPRTRPANQGDFLYRLTDTCTGRTVWERLQEPNEGSPAEVVVGDCGWSVFRTHALFPRLLAVSPAGEVAVRVRIISTRPLYRNLPEFVDAETWLDEHVCRTSAGTYWAESSWRYFLSVAGTSYFVWRTCWGRRIVFDLDRRVRLTDDEATQHELVAAFADAESTWAAEYVRQAAEHVAELQQYLDLPTKERMSSHPAWPWLDRLLSAVNLCGVHTVARSADDLLRLEPLAWVRSWGRCRVTNWSLETEKFRPVVQQALRRLGRTPRGFAPFHFASRDGRRLPEEECLTDREERFTRLRPGMTPVQVLEHVGAPDEHGESHWEYDFLTDAGWVTRQVCWTKTEDGCQLHEVRTVPAVWLTDPLREQKHLRG